MAVIDRFSWLSWELAWVRADWSWLTVWVSAASSVHGSELLWVVVLLVWPAAVVLEVWVPPVVGLVKFAPAVVGVVVALPLAVSWAFSALQFVVSVARAASAAFKAVWAVVIAA